MHPRTVVFDAPMVSTDRLCVPAIAPWRIAPLRLDDDEKRALRDGGAALAAGVRNIGVARGFATLLAGQRPLFPLDRAIPQVWKLATAIDRDDAQLACAAALPLLGLGPGLTPSGDDLVGAALFARRLLGMDAEWTSAAQRLIDAAPTRTHAISAALFRDLAEGQTFASLHRLAAVLAAREPALAAACELTGIGHSSGWDMLAGFIIGVSGSAGLRMHKDTV
jgi:hypothetical protein